MAVNHLGVPELLVLMALAVLMFGPKKLPELADALNDAINKFRGGGPGSPSHPVPAADSRLLNRRRPRSENS